MRVLPEEFHPLLVDTMHIDFDEFEGFFLILFPFFLFSLFIVIFEHLFKSCTFFSVVHCCPLPFPSSVVSPFPPSFVSLFPPSVVSPFPPSVIFFLCTPALLLLCTYFSTAISSGDGLLPAPSIGFNAPPQGQSTVTLSIYIHPLLYLSLHLLIYLSIHPSIHPSNYPTIQLFIYLSIYLSIYPSVCLNHFQWISLY